MSLSVVNSAVTFTFDSIGTMTLGAILLLIGYWVKGKIYFLEKFCIPAPVVGGFLFVFLNCLFHFTGVVEFVFDTSLQTLFMLTFFTTVGLGASLVGLTAATFGLVAASLIGGPLGRRLIVKYNLKPMEEDDFHIDTSGYDADAQKIELNHYNCMKNLTFLMLCMTLGSMIVGAIGNLVHMEIPTYVGAMFFAVLVRNVNEKFKFYPFSMDFNERVGDIALGLYLSMALLSLKLWDLASLALPLLVVLCTQTIVLVLLTYFLVFRILGKNYDAAVMCAGLIGHDIGSTPTAVANMTTLHEKYGVSRRALIIVPIVGAFLIDVFYQPFVIWCINVLC